jgi:hypothetical protein
MNMEQHESDKALVAAFFREVGGDTLEPALPDPGTLWWKAQLRARRAAIERAARPILIVERLAWACGVGTLAAATVWQMPQILALLQQPVYLVAAVLATALVSAAAATLYLVWGRE